jgi:bla regulator protein blaR1
VILWLNSCAAIWFNWMAAMLWQSAILIAIVWAADLLLRRFAWPQFRYILWLLVFVKLLLPPGFALPTSVTSSGFAVVNNLLHRNVAVAKLEHYSNARQAVPTPNQTVQTNLPVESSHTEAPSLSWRTKLMLVWLVGILLLAFWLFLQLRRLRIDRSQPGLPEWFPSVLQECADKLSIKAPAVAITSAVKCPAVFGIFKPTVLLPRECVGLLEKKQISNVLIHELMHIKRGDLLVHAVQIALQILYWPNILLWMIRRPMHDLRELCCDASAAAILRENTPSYRQTLLDVARRLIAERANPGLGLLGLFEQPHTIVARLRYLEKPYGKQTLCKYISAFSAFMMLFAVLPMSPVGAQTGRQEKSSSGVASPSNYSQNKEKPRFEVVSIKRLAQEERLSSANFQPGGRFKAVSVSIRGLIAQFYKMPSPQIVGGDKWIDDVPWNIEAKLEDDKYPLKNNLLDPDVGSLMVQSMLEDRFKLKMHQETRILPGYELIIGKGGPKLTQPKSQTTPPPAGRGVPPPPPTRPGGSLSRTTDSGTPISFGTMPGFFSVKNISLSVFATYFLPSMLSSEGGKNRIHVVDKTGLAGSYDIVLVWTPAAGNTSVASQNRADVDPETTIFDAMQEQLGLKLTSAKVTVPVLVVDDAQMPATN